METTFRITGLMSGTSLDGVDIALCSFEKNDSRWNYKILCAQSIPYNSAWKEKLQNAHRENTCNFLLLHNEYGRYLGKLVKAFLDENNVCTDCISSHGHTVFHQPDKALTFQLGSGACISAEAGLPVICDFRSMDVALGGQGAPLVPIGDKILFSEYEFCLNLGGFANISFESQGSRIAFDICPLNITANHYSAKACQDFDKNGELGARGNINEKLLHEMEFCADKNKGNALLSLSREWVEEIFLPIVEKYNIHIKDKLRTLYEYAAREISKTINDQYPGKTARVLVTGGGAYNSFFTGRLKSLSRHSIIIPNDDLIQFKEALLFAFLGVLRIREENNCLQSVTGALKNNSGGCIYISTKG